MGRMRWVGTCAVVCGLATGAHLSAQTQSGSELTSPQPSVDLPPALDRVLRDYERHWTAGDAEALANLFVPEGLIVRGTWIRGRAAIERAYSNASGALRLRAIEFGEGEDYGHIIGAYGYGTGASWEDGGLFTLTLQKDSTGRWLIVSDMDRGISP